MNKIQEIKQIIKDKVEGVWIPKHDCFGHHYLNTKTGLLVDSVTQKDIMSRPHLVKWSAKMCLEKFIALCEAKKWNPDIQNDKMLLESCILASDDIKNDAGSIGTLGHATIENFVNKWISSGERPKDIRDLIKPDADPRVWAVARSAEAIFKRYNVIPIASELLVGVEKYKSAGTLDMLVWNVDEEWLEVWDWKSSNSISQESYSIQAAAYIKFFEEMTGLKIKKVMVVKLSKKYDQFDIYVLKNIPSAFKAWKANGFIYDWRENGKPKLIKKTKIIKI